MLLEKGGVAAVRNPSVHRNDQPESAVDRADIDHAAIVGSAGVDAHIGWDLSSGRDGAEQCFKGGELTGSNVRLVNQVERVQQGKRTVARPDRAVIFVGAGYDVVR